MKKAALLGILMTLLVPVAMFAVDGAAIYNAKCKMCHGPDAKKIAKADLSKSEADLVKFVTTDTKHKTKLPDEATATAVVAYMKALHK